MESSDLSGAESVSTRSSVSPSPVSSNLGRPRKSLVWNYFTYDTFSGKSTCQVPTGDASEPGSASSSPIVCGKTFVGKFPSNLKQHLKTCHVARYHEMLKEEEKEKEEKEAKKSKSIVGIARGQKTLGEAFQRKYDKESRKYRDITRKLAVFIGSCNVPNSLVENEEFRSFVQVLDPRYHVPGRARICKEIDQVLLGLKAKIQEFIADAQKITLCADIWTKKGMTSSYLGITGHFFCRLDQRKHIVTLAVRNLPHPHNAEHIRSTVDTVLGEWNIPLMKVMAVVTDNGSNMVKAFREMVVTDDEEEEAEAEDEAKFTSDDEDNADFVEKEIDHEITFKFYCKRLGCFSHTLQLVMLKFSERSFKPFLKKVHTLIGKVNKSSRATEALISKCRKKLVRDCPTRWSSSYLMLERLLELRSPLSEVLNELGWDNLALSEWRLMECICNLLKPFAVYTCLISGEEYTTISSALPILMEVNLHLEEMKKNPDVAEVSTVLQSELKRRFRKCTDPADETYEPLYLVSTLLDPRYKPLLNPVQLNSGKEEVLKLMKEANGDSSASSACSGSPSSHQESEDAPPKKKSRFSHLSKVLEEKVKEGLKKASKQPPGGLQLEQYLENVHTFPDEKDPLEFWIENREAYPTLSSVAVDILSIPCSSAPVERVFSTAGNATTGKRNRLTDQNLEREVLIRKNKDYLRLVELV